MTKRLKCLFIIGLIFMLPATSLMHAEKQKKRIYHTKSIEGNPPQVDGRIDDKVWDKVNWSGDFIQRSPYEGKKPAEETNFKILYGKKNLYIAIRAFDSEPKRIEKRLARRDHFAGDWVEVNIDSMHDLRTAYSFTLTAAGVKGDEAITSNGSNWDSSWNPVWYAKTKIDEKGWTGEMKIPYSQLRFGKKKKHVWGIQFTRRIFRKEERSCWQLIPQNAPGWVYLFGELHGIEGINAPRQVEIVPYLLGKAETFEKEEGNPFATGSSFSLNGGIDGKVGVTSNLTLDFTINPDFGQVEADPSEVNLTTFETFFRERRPFFVEGSSILNFKITSGDGGFSRDNLFYSRRIGRVPHYYPDTEDDEFVDFPANTRIIAAAKLTGKTKRGLSIALMESVTARENAEIDLLGSRRKQTVEPFTNYFALRLQQDFRKGDTRIGGMFTAVNRDIKNSDLEFLHSSAYSGGLDFVHNWKKKTYYLSLTTLFSHVRGSKEAILETQESSRRYFQRPDADHIERDPERTSLSGHGGTLSFGRDGKGRIKVSTGVTWRSPGLELNDVGFLRSADRIMQWTWLGYRMWKPFSIFRNLHLNFNQYQTWDFGGTHLSQGGNINLHMMFKNYWTFSTGIEREFLNIATTELRGGPSIKLPGRRIMWSNIGTDGRKKIQFFLRQTYAKGDGNASDYFNWGGTVRVQPSNAVSVSISPSFTRNKKRLQYIDTMEYKDQSRFIFAKIDQKTVALTIRCDVSISPEMTIQFYGQPFISAGKYSALKQITNPRAAEFDQRFLHYDTSQVQYDDGDEVFNFDENNDGSIDYTIDQPNFNFMQFRSNLVLRWEYTPGSTVFLVWSQGRTGTDNHGDFSFSQDFRDLFKVTPHNVFLLKFAHRFNL